MQPFIRLVALAGALALPIPAHAFHPLITDDAGTQGTGGNQLEAARILGVTRTTLRTKLRQLGIAIDRVVVGGDETGQDPLADADGDSSR